MSKFKIGDKVKLRDDLELGEVYNGICFIDQMRKNLGKEFVVYDIDIYGYYTIKNSYILNESFSEEMLEPINKIESNKTESEEIKMEQNNNKLEQLKAEFEGLVKQYKIEMETIQTNFNTKLEELKKEIEKEKNKEKPFVIEEGEEYFYIDSTGNVYFSDWTNRPVDKKRLDFGNCFPYTEENEEEVRKEVEFKLKERKLWAKIERFAKTNQLQAEEIDWNNNEQEKWCLYINYDYSIVAPMYVMQSDSYRFPFVPYFTSKEFCLEIIHEFREEIRELYFN